MQPLTLDDLRIAELALMHRNDWLRRRMTESADMTAYRLTKGDYEENYALMIKIRTILLEETK